MPRFARHGVILCVAAAVSAAAANSDPWLKITSANFELYTTGGERSGRDLVRHFEQVRSFFLQAFGNNLPDAKPACIIAFRNEKEFEPYRPTEFASAFFHAGLSHDFIVMSYGSRDPYPVAVHEFTHMMVHEGGHQYPPWLNEGLAVLFSNLQPLGNKIKVGQDIPGQMMRLQSERWLPLATLLAVDHSSPYYNEKSKAGIFYAESWELVHMLFLHPAYRPQLKALDGALKQGDSATALEAVYHQSLPAIESDLRGYLRGGTIKVMLFDIQLPKAVDAPEVETSAGMGARLALAEVLSNYPGRSEQASAAYESLAKEYPNRWEVEEGWGQLCRYQRKLGDAARHYASAVELGGQDPRLFLDYGRVLYYSGRLADAIDILGKAARLNPADDDIHFELGSVYLRHGNYGAALAELRTMKKVQPAQAYRYFYSQAFAEYHLGQTAEAGAHAAKARSFTRNPEEQASLDRLDRALEGPALQTGSNRAPHTAGAPTEAPRAVRGGPAQETAPPPTPPVPALPTVEGTLENLECGTPARLHVRVDGKIRIFTITDPRSVTIRSGNGTPVDMQCGPQKPPHRLRIEYQALPAQSDAAGLVRSLEFQ